MKHFNRLRNWKVGTRLAIGFGLILTLVCVVALLGLMGLERTRSLHDVFLAELDARQQGHQINALLQQDLIKSQAIIRSAGMPEVTDRFKPELLKADEAITQQLAKLTQHPQPDVRRTAASLQKNHQAYVQTRNGVLDLVETGQTLQATEREQSALVPSAAAVTRDNEALQSLVHTATRRAQSDYDTSIATSEWLISILTLVTLVAGAAWAWLIARSVSRPALAAMKVSEAIAEGQLALHVHAEPAQDELGRMLQSMKRMRDSLVQLTSEVRDQSEQVARTSRDVATGATHVTHSAQRHAEDLAQSRGVLEQIERDIHLNLEHTRRASELATLAREAAQHGQGSMTQVNQTMQGIRTASHRVADIIGVIDGIAFQTNILALNAAVEAARAGEQGRGFAVVASEVRSLAQRSANAAREIKQLITDNVERVSAGADQVSHTSTTIQGLQGTIEEVASLIQGLSASCGQHAHAISQVRQTVHQLDATTQENLTLMSQSTAAAAGLEQQADKLLESVSVFRLTAA